MKRTWSSFDLHGKFGLLAAVGLVIWLFNFFIVYFEINHINQATMSLERFEDLYNSILEIRRYEKNFLLYKNRTTSTKRSAILNTPGSFLRVSPAILRPSAAKQSSTSCA